MPPRYRSVSVQMWNDEKFLSLSDKAMLVFNFILTSPHQTSLGAFRATPSTLGAEFIRFKGIKESGWGLDDFRRACGEIAEKKILICDPELPLIWLPHFLKHNKPNSLNVVKSWPHLLQTFPDCRTKTKLFNYTLRYIINDLGESYIMVFGKAFTMAYGKDYRKVFPKDYRKAFRKVFAITGGGRGEGRTGIFISREEGENVISNIQPPLFQNQRPNSPPSLPDKMAVIRLKLKSAFCPDCGKQSLIIKKGKKGDFVSCPNYPACRYSRNLSEFDQHQTKPDYPKLDNLPAAPKLNPKEQKAAHKARRNYMDKLKKLKRQEEIKKKDEESAR